MFGYSWALWSAHFPENIRILLFSLGLAVIRWKHEPQKTATVTSSSSKRQYTNSNKNSSSLPIHLPNTPMFNHYQIPSFGWQKKYLARSPCATLRAAPHRSNGFFFRSSQMSGQRLAPIPLESHVKSSTMMPFHLVHILSVIRLYVTRKALNNSHIPCHWSVPRALHHP